MRVCLIPAAGLSSRMRGGDKLLEQVNGTACLRVLAERASDAGAEVIVTLPSATHPRSIALDGHPAQRVYVSNASDGMSVSIKAGISAVPISATGVMILPGDMPEIAASDMIGLWERFETERPAALQATTQDGARGHPIIFSSKLIPEFQSLEGDKGAFRILHDHDTEIMHMALPGNRARLDLDTPEDWAVWRKSLGT